MAKMLVCAAVAAIGLSAVAADVVKDGKPVAAIRIGDQVTLREAAQELTNWVAKITGAAVPVNPPEEAKTEIFIGTPKTSKEIAAFAAAHPEDFAKLADGDGFVIAEEGGFFGFGKARIYIAGVRPCGARNGMYWFLTENSDLVFARPLHADDGFGTIYGETRDFANSIRHVVRVATMSHHRYFTWGGRWQTRLGGVEKYYYWKYNPDWQRNTAARIDDIRDCEVSVGFGAIDKYKDTDPDIFALLPNGKRDFGHDHQLCFMNPKAAKLYAEELAAVVTNVPSSIRVRLSLGLGDNWNLCTCKEFCSSPIDCGNGKVVKPTDRNFRSTQYAVLVNRLNDLLKGRFKNVEPLSTGMYLFLTDAPGVIPESKSSGCYCPYVKNHKKPVFDDSVNKVWHEKAEGFYRAGMHFDSIYEYYLCTSTPKYFNAICEVMQQDLRYYRDHGVTGFYIDSGCEDYPGRDEHGNWVFDISAIEFWTAMRLMWDADADVKAIRREYCRRAYREAGELMGDYYEKLAEVYNADSAGCYWNDDPISACNHYVVEKGLAAWVRKTLAEAERLAVHPGSKELVHRHRIRMESMLAKAEALPKKLTYEVKQVTGVKPDMELEGAFWKDIAPLAPMTQISSADKPERGKTVFKLAHDLNNCYLLAYFENPYYHDKMVAAEKGPKPKPTDQFQWDTPLEIYFDGDYAPLGTYHFFSYMYNGVLKYTGKGPTPDTDPRPWSVENKSTLIGGKKGMISLLTFPLKTIGVDISKGNKCGFQVVSGGSGWWGCSWNGGQWHSPTGFQTLRFEMK